MQLNAWQQNPLVFNLVKKFRSQGIKLSFFFFHPNDPFRCHDKDEALAALTVENVNTRLLTSQNLFRLKYLIPLLQETKIKPLTISLHIKVNIKTSIDWHRRSKRDAYSSRNAKQTFLQHFNSEGYSVRGLARISKSRERRSDKFFLAARPDSKLPKEDSWYPKPRYARRVF